MCFVLTPPLANFILLKDDPPEDGVPRRVRRHPVRCPARPRVPEDLGQAHAVLM